MPVSELGFTSLRHATRTHRRWRLLPEARSERRARVKALLASAARKVWQLCSTQLSTCGQGRTNADWGLPVASPCKHAVSQHLVHVRCPAQALKPRNHAGLQRCAHKSVKLDIAPTSDGMVPVSELPPRSLQHATCAIRRHASAARGAVRTACAREGPACTRPWGGMAAV